MRYFKPPRKNTLRGFANVELSNGLMLIECPVLEKNGKAWAALPSRPSIGQEGRHVEINGKKQRAPVLRWRSREVEQSWSRQVVELVRARYPEAFE